MKKIAIIGAGPYGLIALDRLVKQVSAAEQIKLFLFDPYGPGGNVWRRDQNDQVIMNTVMQHVTLFSEEEGPNLAEWNQTEAPDYLASLNCCEEFSAELQLEKNDYCQRRYYGLYQCWFFDQLINGLPKNVTVELIKEKVVDLTIQEKNIVIQASKAYKVTDVILATGHSPNRLSEEEAKNQKFAEENGLFYQAPGNPSDTLLNDLVEDERVILRGLGLFFFDYTALFVAKWGGCFIKKADRLVYQPSGKEQRLIVGSGRGLPYHARPDNQKDPGEDAQPQILTEAFMEDFQGSAAELFDLLKKEAELAYYQKKLAKTSLNLNEFLQDYRKNERLAVLEKYQVPDNLRIDWDSLFDPAKEVSSAESPDFIKAYLEQDITEAELGNQTGAVATAIDTYKELQAPFNYMLDHQKFTPKEYFADFFGSFNRSYSFLTIGAPVIRQKQLLALVEAGVVEFLAPKMTIERENGQFFAYSKQDVKRVFSSKNLIEARLPATSLQRTKNPLLINMREKGYLTPHNVPFDGSDHFTGALRVNRDTHQIIDCNDEVVPHIFCYGIPLEGLDWLNAASPRPQSSDRVFFLANQIVQTILQQKEY